MKEHNINTALLLRLFIPFGLGYTVSYLFRSVNAVIAPDLLETFGISAAHLGLLTSTYFLCFAAFQLPLGILLDRYGPRRVEGGLLLIAAIGALIFSLSESFTGLLVGRALIGLGVSACLMAAFKAFSTWLPKERLAFAHGLQMVSGGLGALLATTPVQLSLNLTDWRGLFQFLALITFVIAIVIYFVVPDQHRTETGESLIKQVAGLRQVIGSAAFWLMTPWAVTTQATYLSIQGLWAGPWLRDVVGLERDGVAHVLWWIAIAMIVGYFVIGSLAERLGRRGIQIHQVAATGMSLFMVSQALLLFAPISPTLLWISFGLFGTTGILNYAILAQNFPKHLIGRCNSVLNLLIFSGAFAAQWLIGAIISLYPPTAEGAYPAASYRAAFFTLLICQMSAAIWFTYNRANKR